MLNDRSKGCFEIAIARRRDHEQFLPDGLRSGAQITKFLRCIRAIRMSEQRNYADVGNELACQLKPLRPEARPDEGYPRDVAAWPVEARNQTSLDRIKPPYEHNGNGRRHRPCRECRLRRQRREQVYPPAHTIGPQCRQSTILAFRHARLDSDISADGVPCLAQSVTERSDPFACDRC